MRIFDHSFDGNARQFHQRLTATGNRRKVASHLSLPSHHQTIEQHCLAVRRSVKSMRRHRQLLLSGNQPMSAGTMQLVRSRDRKSAHELRLWHDGAFVDVARFLFSRRYLAPRQAGEVLPAAVIRIRCSAVFRPIQRGKWYFHHVGSSL